MINTTFQSGKRKMVINSLLLISNFKQVLLSIILVVNMAIQTESQITDIYFNNRELDNILIKLDSLITFRHKDHNYNKDSQIIDQSVLNFINESIMIYPNSYQLYMKKGLLLNDLNLLSDAFESFSKAIEIAPENPMPYFYRGQLVLFRFKDDPSTSNMEVAIKDFKKYGSFSEDKLTESFNYIAQCYEFMGNNLKAIEYYTYLINSNIKNDKFIESNIYLSRGMSYKAINSEKAFDDLKIAVEIEPNCYNKRWLARYLFDNNRYEEASPYLTDECLSSYDDYYMKSYIITEIEGDLEKALQYVKYAIERYDEIFKIVSPDEDRLQTLESYLRLRAVLNEKTNRPSDVLKDLMRIKAINPKLQEDYDFLLWFVDAKNDNSDYIGALKDINLLIEKYPNNGEVHSRKGMVLYNLGDYYGSINSYNKSISIEPKNGYYLSMRAWSKLRLNDTSGACSDWSTAGELGYLKAYDNINDNCK